VNLCQTSKKINRQAKLEGESGTNEHLYITIDANILKKATESKSKRPDPNPENPKESKSNISNPDPENPEESKSNNRIRILKTTSIHFLKTSLSRS